LPHNTFDFECNGNYGIIYRLTRKLYEYLHFLSHHVGYFEQTTLIKVLHKYQDTNYMFEVFETLITKTQEINQVRSYKFKTFMSCACIVWKSIYLLYSRWWAIFRHA